MAIILLTNTQTCQGFWRRCILANLQFWQAYLAQHAADVAALDQEWEGVTKAITLGLETPSAWPLVYDLITAWSSFMERRGYWDVWQTILERALIVAAGVGDEAGEVTLSALSARLAQRQGRFQQMTAGYRRTLRLARRNEDRFNEGRALTNLGYFYIEHGYWARAERLCCHALEIFEEIDSDHGRAHTENHLGILYTWQSLWDQAQQHLERACTIWRAMDDHHGLMRGFINLGTLYIQMKQAKEALFYLEKAISQSNITGEKFEVGTIYMNMGLAYQLNDEPVKAIRYTRQAETFFRSASNISGLMDASENLGVIYLAQRKWSEAVEYLEHALEGWRLLNNKHDEIKTILHLAECELIKGDHEKANGWIKEAERHLNEQASTGQNHQLYLQVKNLRRSLTENITWQAAAK